MGKLEVTQFNGDIDALAKVTEDAWRYEYGKKAFPDLYRREILEYYLSATNPEHHVAAYEDGVMIGFLGNLARKYSLYGEACTGALSGLLVVHKDHMRKGLAIKLIAEAIARNEKAKVDFSLNFLDRGHSSTYVINKFSEQYEIQYVKDIHPIVRILNLNRMKATEGLKFYESLAVKMLGLSKIPEPRATVGKIRAFEKKDAKECMELLNSYQYNVPLHAFGEKEKLKYSSISQKFLIL